MSLETRIISLVQSVAADIKSIYAGLAGKVNNNDTRLTNSREWSEETIIQAEAEAGAATTRRAWTSQRVRQAITAWWSSIANAVAITGGTINGTSIGASTAAAGKFTDVATTGTLGVGATPPHSNTKVYINKGSFGGNSTSLNNNLLLESDGAINVIYNSPANGLVNHWYRDPDNASSGVTGVFSYSHATDTFEFNKPVVVSAGQIKFPAAQNASTDANTLDDYEEGTWTPGYTPTTGAFDLITYDAIRVGRYTKVGRLVTVEFLLRTTDFSPGTAGGGVRLSGLPFTSTNGNTGTGIAYSGNFGVNAPNSVFLSGQATYANLYYKTSMNAPTSSLQVSDLATGATPSGNYIAGSFSYFAS